MDEPRPGYDEGVREMGRRAAVAGRPITHVDIGEFMSARDLELWREGWREQRRKALGLSVFRNQGHGK